MGVSCLENIKKIILTIKNNTKKNFKELKALIDEILNFLKGEDLKIYEEKIQKKISKLEKIKKIKNWIFGVKISNFMHLEYIDM